jgi:FAD/FMN-containing dehydrogenase
MYLSCSFRSFFHRGVISAAKEIDLENKDLQGVQTSMTIQSIQSEVILDTALVEALRASVEGEVLEPAQPGYDEARKLANARFDRYPALIVRCQSSHDVIQAVRFARAHELPIAVRSGGHSITGLSAYDDAVMVDLQPMTKIDLDAVSGVARVQMGVTNGMLVHSLGSRGFATTTGTCATVGMGGSTLGGGIGWLMGRFGMTIDNVLAFELVTAEGELIVANDEENPDLFWALRGGGGNFGIVTSVVYKVHPLSEVYAGLLIFPLVYGQAVLRSYRDIVMNAPDELIAHANIATIPDMGEVIMIAACYSGDDFEAGERLLAPLRQAATPIVDAIGPRSYVEFYMMATPVLPPNWKSFDTAYSLTQPTDAALDELLAISQKRSLTDGMAIHLVQGAATRVAPNATAFALREAHLSVANVGMWLEGEGEANIAWAREACERMQPYASKGVYVNFHGDDESEDELQAAYRANYQRLAEIKARYDRYNIFHLNRNIRPLSGK